MAIRNILVPVDGSACSLRALSFAARRFRNSKGDCLLLLYVEVPLPPSRHIRRSDIDDHYRRRAEEALTPARERAERLGVEFQSYLRRGDPAQVIAAFAQRTSCREIIMGSRGLGRIAGLVLGSVAMKVIHLADVPVTLVK